MTVNMKMTSHTLPAVQSWLGQELETRGIDAVIYTRYILSILQQDGFEPDIDVLDSEPFRFRKQKQGGRINGKGKKRKSLLKSSTEDRKKIAVLECLQSVTEEECGIEGLVEELCMKLKKVQEERDEKAADEVFLDNTDNEGKEAAESVKDTSKQAERYYAAFPALDGSNNTKPANRDPKPKGVWSSLAGSAVLLPGGSATPESRSACVSRSSTSPTDSDDKKQRTRSLPSSLAPTRKNSFNSGRKKKGQKVRVINNEGLQRELVSRYRDREPFLRYNKTIRGGKKGSEHRNLQFKKRERSYPPSKPATKVELHIPRMPEKAVFNRQTEPVHLPSPEDEPEQSLWEERDPLKDNENGDFFLEQAVHSMAESICLGIVDEHENDVENTGESGERNEVMVDTLSTGRGRWLPSHPAECFGDPSCASVLVMCDAEVLAPGEDVPCVAHPGTVWESDLVLGSPTLPEKGPWLESARSCLQATPNLLSPDIPEQRGSISEDHSENTSVSEELSVVIDDEPFTQDLNSPRNAPIGTGRGNDTLLRICNHDHSGRAKQQELEDPASKASSEVEWPSMEDKSKPGETDQVSSDAVNENIWGGFVADQQQGSLAEGIRSSCTHDPTTVTTTASSDVNTALWSTYDTAPARIQPPKVVTWDETILSPLVSHLKTGSASFIEGGVYGSPYGSRNNSHYNSCSTSPGNEGSLLDLWGSKEHMQELTAAASKLEEYFSPRPSSCQPLWSDEQSIIEDSLADSPKFLSSRSSSRFDFAQPTSPPNSDRSSPTETDDMVSETEAFEETVRRKEKFVMESALNVKCNIGKDGSNSFISMQDSCRLDANSNINQVEYPQPVGQEVSENPTKDVNDVTTGLERTSLTSISDNKDRTHSLTVVDNRINFTPIEPDRESSSKSDSASRVLQFSEEGYDWKDRRDASGGSLSEDIVQSTQNDDINNSSKGFWGITSELTDNGQQGTSNSFVMGLHPSTHEGSSVGSVTRGARVEISPDDGMSHLSYFRPEVKTRFSEQLFPFEEEVFLKEEGLLAHGESISYCDACSDGRTECQECNHTHTHTQGQHLSRNSSIDDQEWEGSRRSGSRKVERGSYSSRPPEEMQGKAGSSKPIQISNSR